MINSSEPFGIDINGRDDEGETGFMKACWKGQTEIVKLMMKSSKKFGIDLNTRDGDGGTGLMMACKNGCKETVMLMLENHKKYGINIKQETYIWETALGLLGEDCSNQSEEDIKYIIQVLEEAYRFSVIENWPKNRFSSTG